MINEKEAEIKDEIKAGFKGLKQSILLASVLMFIGGISIGLALGFIIFS